MAKEKRRNTRFSMYTNESIQVLSDELMTNDHSCLEHWNFFAWPNEIDELIKIIQVIANGWKSRGEKKYDFILIVYWNRNRQNTEYTNTIANKNKFSCFFCWIFPFYSHTKNVFLCLHLLPIFLFLSLSHTLIHPHPHQES